MSNTVPVEQYNAVVGRLNALGTDNAVLKAEVDRLQAEIEAMRDVAAREARLTSEVVREVEALKGVVEFVKGRKNYYKGIVERVRVLLNAMNLLDVDVLERSILIDAIEGDNPGHPFGSVPPKSDYGQDG